MNGVYDGIAFIEELGYDYDEFNVEIVLGSIGYDFERDKYNYREMVKKALSLFKT